MIYKMTILKGMRETIIIQQWYLHLIRKMINLTQ